MTRVLIVAGPAVVRAGLESLVRASPSFAVAGVLGEISAFSEQISTLEPDLALIDWSKPDHATPVALNLSSDVPIPMVVLTDEPGAGA